MSDRYSIWGVRAGVLVMFGSVAGVLTHREAASAGTMVTT